MKQLPNEKKLTKLLEVARSAAEKANELYEMATIMALKCELRTEKRLAANSKQKD